MNGEERSSSPNIVTIVKRVWVVHVACTRKKRVAYSVSERVHLEYLDVDDSVILKRTERRADWRE